MLTSGRDVLSTTEKLISCSTFIVLELAQAVVLRELRSHPDEPASVVVKWIWE